MDSSPSGFPPAFTSAPGSGIRAGKSLSNTYVDYEAREYIMRMLNRKMMEKVTHGVHRILNPVPHDSRAEWIGFRFSIHRFDRRFVLHFSLPGPHRPVG